MAGIAGIMKNGMRSKVEGMLDKISTRGEYGRNIIETHNATIGIIWSKHEDEILTPEIRKGYFKLGPGFGHSVGVEVGADNLVIKRGQYGIVPVFIAKDNSDTILFASEIKALLPGSGKIIEFLPGQQMINGEISTYFELTPPKMTSETEEEITGSLRRIINSVIEKRIRTTEVGVWLSGGIDSSIITGLLKPRVKKIHSFTGGLKNSDDLKEASFISHYFGTEHHEVVIDKKIMLEILPDVIFHLETFDIQLVRSGIISMCMAWAASDYVAEIFTGDAADELFAGYDYLKVYPAEKLNDELITLIRKMPQTSLQRVDRSAYAFGLTPHIAYADPELVGYALSIPGNLKIKDGTEKWILRHAFQHMLPDEVFNRPKNKIWQGSGIESVLADYAESSISDFDFRVERQLPNGWYLSNKEQLLYYRIFKQHFGEFSDLSWMGLS